MTSTTTNTPRALWPGQAMSTLLDYAAASHAKAIGLLLALSLLAFLPGFFQIPPVDRDEARFAQATKQMIETGDYVDIRFQDEVRYKKPVGIYWLQAAVVNTASALGVREATTKIWLYRIPSLIGAIGTVLLTYWAGLAFVTRRGALLAAAMMAGSILLGVEARLAKTDAMLMLTVLAAMGAMARVYLTDRRAPGQPQGWTMPVIFWTALAGGILIKGPLILMFVGLTAVALGIADRSVRWLKALRPLPGFVWMVVLVLPWFLAIIAKSGGAFFAQSVGEDMLSKVTSGQESHGGPPGIYFLLYWVTFWPGAVLTGLALPAIWAARRQPAAQFLLAWLVPSWIVFEIVMTKLPHYVLPLYPAIAILLAGAVEVRLLVRGHWIERGTIWWFVVPIAISLFGIVIAITVGRQLALIAWPFAAGTMVLGMVAWLYYDSRRPEISLLNAIAASVVMMFGFYAVLVPRVPQLFPAKLIAEAIADSECARPLAAAAGYHEPSLVFLVGTATRLVDGPGAADFLREGPCRFALIDHRQERAFAQRADVLGLRYAPGPRIEGVNISGGRKITIAIYKSDGTP
ncbi:MAG: glycosyl transferase, family 39 [Xanthobacteraceae bacterium]|nr:glycosyl transferase, family 39 [Xanthobacteraceae bacterium]